VRQRVLLFATLVLGLGASLAAWWSVRQGEAKGVHRAVEEEADQVAERVEFDLAVRMDTLGRMAHRWVVSGGLPHEIWAADALQYVQTVAGFYTIEWVDADGIIRWIVPEEGNEAVLGFDAKRDPARVAGMERSRALGAPEVVAPVDLLQGGIGILVHAPLQVGPRFDGWLVGVFRVDEFVAETHGAVPGYRVAIRHGARLVYSSAKGPVSAFCAYRVLDPVDPSLELEVCAGEDLVEASRGPFPLLTLAIGLGFTALSSGLVVALGTARARSAEARALTEKVRARARDLDRAHRELADFSYSVSHELRTPLRAIDGHAAILAEEAPASQRAALDRIRSNAQRMARQVDGLIEILRLARAEPNPRRVDVSALAKGRFEALRRADPERDVTLRVADDVAVDADPDLVSVILGALLDNAWKFTRGRAQAIVEVGPHPGGFYVRDNGVGFDMAYAPKLFRTFESLHRPGEFEGLGLGLAIAARAAASHGGDIRAESRPGEGATFTVTLSPAA
jgi:signal transduction histidine kinase